MTLFDTIPEPAKREAIARVWQGTDDEWRVMAIAALRERCLWREFFTTDDLSWLTATAREPRAMGGLLKYGQSQGWCVPTDRMIKSTQTRKHHRRITVWRSLIVE